MIWFGRQLWKGIGVLWGIVSLLFLIFYTFGDPTEYAVGDSANEATQAAIRAQYGLDKPLGVQYLRYLNQLSPVGYVDSSLVASTPHWVPGGTPGIGLKAPFLGRSFQTRTPVSEMIGGRLMGTLILALAAISIAAIFGIGMGIISAYSYGKWLDQTILSLSVLGISAPSFFVGVLMAWLFAVKWQSWTGLQANGYILEYQVFELGRVWVPKNLILPALALGIRPLAIFVQLTRSSMIDVLQTDYMRTAYAKGLSRLRVLGKHALQNALNPVITAVTGWLASLLAGAFFIEYIFNWPGIGKLTIDALLKHDYPVIMGCALTVGSIFVGVSILTDQIYRWLDPRVK